MSEINSKKKKLVNKKNTPKNNSQEFEEDLDKQLNKIAKQTMQDYKHFFKKLEKY